MSFDPTSASLKASAAVFEQIVRTVFATFDIETVRVTKGDEAYVEYLALTEDGEEKLVERDGVYRYAGPDEKEYVRAASMAMYMLYDPGALRPSTGTDLSRNVWFGCYGFGLQKCLYAIVDQHRSDQAVLFPDAVRPFDVSVLTIGNSDDRILGVSEGLVEDLQSAGLRVLFDDRPKQNRGEKSRLSDLYGTPQKILIGRNEVHSGCATVKSHGRDGDERQVPIADVSGAVLAAHCPPKRQEKVSLMNNAKSSYESEVVKYFEEKASGYDLVERQTYWRLSNELLWYMLSNLISENLPPTFRFLDAGGGTGRWSERLLRAFPDCTGVIYDLSPDMLSVASAKKEADPDGIARRWEIRRGDLHELDYEAEFDLVICFHNVLGFVWNAEQVMGNLAQALKPEGRLCLVAPNKLHGIYFTLTQGDVRGAEAISASGRGAFVGGMPDMDFFDATQLQDTLSTLALRNVTVRGFPMLIYPGYSETQIHGQTQSLSDLLSDPEVFSRIYDLEVANLENTAAAMRGNNLFVTAEKP